MADNDGEYMNTQKRQLAEGSAWRSPWVWGMIGLVTVMVTVNLIMITIGINTHPGLVVDDFYDRGKNYFNAEIKRQEDLERLGWQLELVTPGTPVLQASQTYQLKVVDAGGYPLSNALVVLEAFRPSNASKDFAVPLVEQDSGSYSAPVEFALPGNWDLLVTVKKGEDRMDIAQRVFIKD